MARFAVVIELLAYAGADLDLDLARVDGAVHLPMQREEQVELAEIRLDGGFHVRVLQLAGQRRAIRQSRPVNLAEGGCGGRLLLETAEAGEPVRAQFGGHPAAHEDIGHGRRLGLELAQLLGIFGGNRLRDGGDKLGHLHQRALEAAERAGQRGGIAAVGLARPARQQRAGDPRGHATHVGADTGIARGAGGKSVLFGIGHARDMGLARAFVESPGRPCAVRPQASMPSSSMIMPSMTERPICQKAGSRASRPNGASTSE